MAKAVTKKETVNFDKTKFYSIPEAVKLSKELSKTKFTSSIDLAVKLNLDTSKSEQQLRGTVSLPHHFGKTKKILVLDKGLTDKDAKKLNVDFAGDSEKIAEISKGWLGFDLIITTPKMMPELSKLGKILGTRGLMPNPKTGNVTTDLEKTIAEFKKGVSQYRTDSYGNIHMLVGKTDSDDAKVVENIEFLLEFIRNKKPATVKGIFVQNVALSSTMGPGIKIQINKVVDKKSKKASGAKAGKVSEDKSEAKPVYYKPVYNYTRKPKPSKNPENPPKVIEETKKAKPKKTFVKAKKVTKTTSAKPAVATKAANAKVLKGAAKNKAVKKTVKGKTVAAKKPTSKKK